MDKPIIGITTGDINGIGPEIILKVFSDNRMLDFVSPVIYGSAKTLAFYKKMLKIDAFNYLQIDSADKLNTKRVNVINCWDETAEIKVGEETSSAGKYALAALEKASADAKEGLLDAVVTAPVSKNNISGKDFPFAGQTEYFANKFGEGKSLMLMISERLKIGLLTGHIPLSEVKNSLNEEILYQKIELLAASLKNDFGFIKPKIAILGLNPHAGESGTIGTEEDKLIKPVIHKLKDKGMLLFGPYPADSFFATMSYKNFDGILAMYHDQGLIPFKTLVFEEGVNFTAGLPLVRTSPDHGTAYDIAGQHIANEGSMREAIFQAAGIVKMRRENNAYN